MQLAYLKMRGAGNRIVVVDQRQSNLPPPSPEDLRRIGDEKTGPGFDQLMWVGPAQDCVAWMLARDSGEQKAFKLESMAGTIEATVLDDGRITVNMGPPRFDPAYVPFSAEVQSSQYQLDVAGTTLDVSILSMGNAHCIVEVSDVKSADVAGLGPAIAYHERFPAATNVGFMHIRDRSNIALREYERGAGETLACGSGACAAVVAGQRLGQLDEEVTVQMSGGKLVVSWRGESEGVWLTGDAELISEGTVDL